MQLSISQVSRIIFAFLDHAFFYPYFDLNAFFFFFWNDDAISLVMNKFCLISHSVIAANDWNKLVSVCT